MKKGRKMLKWFEAGLFFWLLCGGSCFIHTSWNGMTKHKTARAVVKSHTDVTGKPPKVSTDIFLVEADEYQKAFGKESQTQWIKGVSSRNSQGCSWWEKVSAHIYWQREKNWANLPDQWQFFLKNPESYRTVKHIQDTDHFWKLLAGSNKCKCWFKNRELIYLKALVIDQLQKKSKLVIQEW